MAQGKSDEELMLEEQLRAILADERAEMKRAAADAVELGIFEIGKEDILKGIVLREILGPPKALER